MPRAGTYRGKPARFTWASRRGNPILNTGSGRSTNCLVIFAARFSFAMLQPLRILFLLALLLPICGWGQYYTGFEDGTKGSYASGTVTLSEVDWNFTEALIGSDVADYKVGSRSCRLRGYGVSAITMLENISGAGQISFNYSRFSSDQEATYVVEYSTNDGSDWIQTGSSFTTSAAVSTFSSPVNISGNIRFRIRCISGGSTNKRGNIDEFQITEYSPPCTAPAVGSGAGTVNNLTSSSAEISWPSGTGNGTLVVLREGSAVNFTPQNGQDYAGEVNANFSLATDQGSGNRIVYRNTGSTAAVTGLTPSTTYHFSLWEYVDTDNCYSEAGDLFSGSFVTPGSTSVTLEMTDITVDEDDGLVVICANISDPSPTLATTVDLTLQTPGTPHFTGYSTQTITFPAGSSDAQCVEIDIENNEDCDELSEYIFELVNISGGNSAVISGISQTEVTVNDDDAVETIIYRQDFENSASDTWDYSSSGPGSASTATGAGDTPANGRIKSGTASFQSSDGTSILTFDNLDISGFTDVVLEIANGSLSTTTGNGVEDDDQFKVWVSQTTSFATGANITINGLSTSSNSRWGINGTQVVQTTAPGTISYQHPTGTISNANARSTARIFIPDTWNSLSLKIELLNDQPQEIWSIDDIQLRGKACGTCLAPVVSNPVPNVGPVGTEFLVTGSNFITGGTITDITVNGNSVSWIEILSNDSARAIVAPGTTTGPVRLIREGCFGQSAGNFTMDFSNCSTGEAYPILSELCDPQTNYHTDRYIEIYNPTNVTIDLTGWEVGAYTNGGGSPCAIWTLSGELLPGEAKTCGSANPVNGGPHDFVLADWNVVSNGNTTETCAFNWNGQQQDGAALFFNGEVIDRYLNAAGGNSNAFADGSMVRKNTICAANINSPGSQWNLNQAATTAGSGNSTPGTHSTTCQTIIGASQPVITVQPVSDTLHLCDDASISVTVEGEEPFTYRWYRNNGLNSTWNLVNSTLDGNIYSGFDTNTLEIADLGAVEGYQFQVRISSDDPACYAQSRAVRFEVLPNNKRIYRSVAGIYNWTALDAWQFSEDGTVWETPCRFPEEEFTDSLRVLSGSEITLDVSVTLPHLIIEEGATVKTVADEGLTFRNTLSGADFIVNGTFEDNTATGSSHSFTNGSTWSLGANGTFIKTRDGSAAVFRDNYEAGIASIPASANWIIRRIIGSTLPVLLSVGGMYYPNLTIESSSGLYNPSTSLNTFTGSSASPVIKGNLHIGGSFPANNVIFKTENTAGPILIEGDLIINTGSTLQNQLTLASPKGTGFEVKGNVILNGFLNLSFGSQTGAGQLILSGDSVQTVSGSDSLFVNILEIANAADSVIFDNGNFATATDNDIRINDELIFTQGIGYIPNDSKWLYLNTTATHTGAGSARYIDGKVRKVGSTSFQFPVGGSTADGDGYYQPISISGLSGTGTFEARYYAETHPNAVPYYDGFNFEVGTCDFWSLIRPTGSAISATVTLTYGNNPCNSIGEPEYLSIARWNGLDWENPIDAGVDPLVPFEVSSASAVAANGFGDFALATTQLSENNVLPVSWLFFEARKIEQTAHLVWATATELNNDYYTVYRATANGDFQEIGRLPGAGTSAHSNTYEFTDNHPQPGTNYYRIRQTDFNGDFSETDVRALTFGEGDLALLQSRASFDGLSLLVAAPRGGTLTLTDLNGRVLHSRPLTAGQSEVTLTDRLARGVYLVRLSDDRSEVVHRVVR